MKVVLNKKGEEFVEGSIVMPMIVIIAVLFLLTMVFFFNMINNQCRCQKQLLEEARNPKSIFKIEKISKETSSQYSKDKFLALLNENYRGRIYIIDQSEIIRLGKIIDDKK